MAVRIREGNDDETAGTFFSGHGEAPTDTVRQRDRLVE